ncbi:hypothetical protein GCM10010344_01830 [Streptomyces bluensis]|nr:hypothetical protein GCM10010344_01830 [Streptomyces bluensis]
MVNQPVPPRCIARAQRGGESAVGFAYGQDHEFDRMAGGHKRQRAVEELLRAAGGAPDQDIAAPQAYVLSAWVNHDL